MSIETGKEKFLDKYKPYLRAKGIFRPKTRGRLLGIKTRGRDSEPFETPQEKANFWYRRRGEVRGSFRDLELFIEVSGKNNVNQVITKETLKPVVEALLFKPTIDQSEADFERAEIAKLFIRVGFDYLSKMQKRFIREHDVRIIREALGEANFLVDLFRPESERRHVSALDRPSR